MIVCRPYLQHRVIPDAEKGHHSKDLRRHLRLRQEVDVTRERLVHPPLKGDPGNATLAGVALSISDGVGIGGFDCPVAKETGAG